MQNPKNKGKKSQVFKAIILVDEDGPVSFFTPFHNEAIFSFYDKRFNHITSRGKMIKKIIGDGFWVVEPLDKK